MSGKQVFLLVLFFVFIALSVFFEQKKQTELNRLKSKLENAARFLDSDVARQNGYVVFKRDGERFSQAEMRAQLYKSSNRSGYFWGLHNKYNASGKWKTDLPGTWSKMGTDWKQYFVNSFLLGIHPFEVDNLALPLYALAQRKVYQLDFEQYGSRDIWQNSAEAFINLRGDCEDHAIVLADWLISEGVDAKVVTGYVPQGYHAWVVATLNGREYILEATAKRYKNSWKHYPLAALNTDYHSEMMFNRDNFWVNTDKKNITDYSGDHWELTSTFYRHKEKSTVSIKQSR